jgi:geranylgeranyl transferase type-2 subunit alpha
LAQSQPTYNEASQRAQCGRRITQSFLGPRSVLTVHLILLNTTDFGLELEFIDDGLNVGPEDQSLWYYHQFLVLNLADPTSSRQIAPNLTVDERKSYLEREVTNIKDLLEDYPDIKGIYEALTEYAMALAQLDGQPLGSEKQIEVASWLDHLRKLDPKRDGRWHDLEKQLGLLRS